MPALKRVRSLLPLSLTVCVLALAGPAWAQLTDADIAALRKQGEAEGWTFTVGHNPATARPMHELCGLVEPADWQQQGAIDPSPLRGGLPAQFDWRELGGCTPIKNQGGCGSCWAFAAIGAMECVIKINRGEEVDLSEQWLVSCTDAGSCQGGWHTTASSYLRCRFWYDPCRDSGAVLEEGFPYVARNAPCDCPFEHPHCIDSWGNVPHSPRPTVERIKQAILDYGPVPTAVRVNSAFGAYTGDVFNACESGSVNHAVVLVGWDDNQGTNGVWFLRNSWGPGWGEDGYMRIEYECSSIGYATSYMVYTWEDCNQNGIRDRREVVYGLAEDCNYNYVPDECDIANGTCQDCNLNGAPDECDLLDGTSCDCNENEIPDECDIESGYSEDGNGNGVPDECDVFGDLDCSGVLDSFDIDPFALALSDPDGYEAAYSGCDILLADVNRDGQIDGFDIEAFVALLVGG